MRPALSAMALLCLACAHCPRKEKNMPTRAKGTFDVKVSPLPADEKSGPPTFGRLSIDTLAGAP